MHRQFGRSLSKLPPSSPLKGMRQSADGWLGTGLAKDVDISHYDRERAGRRTAQPVFLPATGQALEAG